jgi:drug/metabolite transporter (DMT)-like permease
MDLIGGTEETPGEHDHEGAFKEQVPVRVIKGGARLRKGVYRSDSLLLLAAVIWGSAFVAQRVGMSYVGPFTFNGVRFALGALVLLPFASRGERHPLGETGDDPKKLPWSVLWGGGLAGVMLFSGATLQQVGLVYTTAGKAGFITGLYVIIVPLMGLFLGHWPGWGGWALAWPLLAFIS